MCQWEEIPRRTATRGWRTDVSFFAEEDVDVGAVEFGREEVVGEAG